MDEQNAAVDKLVQLGSKAIPVLRRTLEEGIPPARRKALAALGAIKSSEALDCIVFALHLKGKKNRCVRNDAKDIIARLHEEDRSLFEDYVTHQLPRKRAPEQKRIAACLTQYFIDEDIVLCDRIADFLENDDWVQIRKDADHRRKIMKRELQKETRKEAMYSLAKNVANLNDHLNAVRQAVGNVYFEEIDPACNCSHAQELIRLLSLCPPQRADGIITSLFWMGEGVIPLLLESLSSPVDELRRRVPRILALFREPKAVFPLMQLCRDPSPKVRAHAVRALAIIGEPSALPAIRPLLQDEQSDVRLHAVRALVTTGGLWERELVRSMMKDLRAEVRAHALIGLHTLKDPSVVNHAREMLSDNATVVRVWCLKILSEQGNESDAPYIKPFLADRQEEVRAKAVAALGVVGTAEIVPELQRLIDDPSTRVRSVALEAVDRLLGRNIK